MATTKAKTPPPPPAEHHIQFLLTEHNTSPITEGRKYKISWTDQGEKALQEQSGTSNSNGLTNLIKTKGRVPITLEIAPPDSSDCKVVGTAFSKPLDIKPTTRVSLGVTATTTTAPKAANKCEVIDVREGKQRIQYVINNITTQGNKLLDLPYLIIDVDKLEPISEKANDSAPKKMAGDSSQVKTVAVNCDGIKNIGLVLGNATDDPAFWKKNADELVLYRVTPKEDGLTTVVIKEMAAPRQEMFAEDTKPKDFKATLSGSVWSRITRKYDIADAKKILSGKTKICTNKPTTVQIEYAAKKSIISANQAAELLKQAKSPTQPKERLTLEFECTWEELLTPIYTGDISDPPPPENKITKKIDQKTKKETQTPQYTDEEYKEKLNQHAKSMSQGQGYIHIPQLDLTIRLDGGATQNAFNVTGLSKADVLKRTHPYAYLVLIEAANTLSIHEYLLSSTWRPMIGSALHKLGDAIDITRIDSKDSTDGSFSYKGSTTNALATRFSEFVINHRYSVAKQLYYIGDAYNASSSADASHDDHLHFTVDRLKPPADCDK
ncbi:MAG: hypothetical protein EPO09_21065 [Aquabacterium sp.]|uniref:hypothetical protein n=1 Tax=Aquabacterium sp. TaxID=1872578 RepID=UPI0012288846|nr:hypothetical protein [Aquabacterium sp.]TAK84226.1 MAG: hypothetical protein EPO09_21065 [Aquabacterium sp.]